MVTLKLQQFQCALKKHFLRRLVFPVLFGPCDGDCRRGGGGALLMPHTAGNIVCLKSLSEFLD